MTEWLGPTDAEMELEFTADLVAVIAGLFHERVSLSIRHFRLLLVLAIRLFPFFVQRQDFERLLKIACSLECMSLG